MTENQKKWLLYLQEKGIKFEWLTGYDRPKWKAFNARFDFNIVDGLFAFQFRIPAQSIPDIPDWRELCREMQSKGVKFEAFLDKRWYEGARFKQSREYYRIPQQPIPEWREEMAEETKPDPREEIPHRELQIQWHEDMLHHLRTGEPMPVWEYRLKNGDGEWKICHDPHFSEKYEYRRKPRTVTYWHCVVKYLCKETGIMESGVVGSSYSKGEVESEMYHIKDNDQTAKFSPITETTVEIED